jgi:membrane protease YdiL (CAAX protease family)
MIVVAEICFNNKLLNFWIIWNSILRILHEQKIMRSDIDHLRVLVVSGKKKATAEKILKENVVKRSSQIYFGMIALTLISFSLSGPSGFDLLKIWSEDYSSLYFAQVFGLSFGILLATSYLFELIFPSYIMHLVLFKRILGGLSVFKILYLSLLAAFAEEMFFRAFLQSSLGIEWSFLLLLLLHLTPSGKLTTYSIMSLIKNFILGIVYLYTHWIYGVILLHFFMNVFSFSRQFFISSRAAQTKL